MTDDGARDERLASFLEVEPLDEVTRRRLVSAALRESAPPARRTGRVVAAVAAATVVVAGGLGLLALNDDGGGVPTANRTPASGEPLDRSAQAAPVPSAAAPSTSVGADTTAESATAVLDAGDLGDLEDPAALGREREALAPTAAATADSTSVAPSSRADDLVARVRGASCASELTQGEIVAVGTGTLDGRDVIVVATRRANGTQAAEAIVVDPCAVHPLG
jgi:hypothetical protein